MLYRLYRPDDFAELYTIEQACFDPPFRFSRQSMRRMVDDRASATWIAEENEQMAGFAIVYWAQAPEQPLAYIQTLEVLPAQRNRGIARELLLRAEDSAKGAGTHVIWLHVAESNAAAIRLYEKHGYLLQGREENYYAKGIAALMYAKPLV